MYNYTIREEGLEATTEEDGAAEATAAGHPGQRPDIRRLCSRQGAAPTDGQQHQRPDIRRQPRTSGASPKPGHLALPPEIRHRRQKTSRSFTLQPGHPAPPEAPDILPVAQTSGHPCLRTVRAEARVPLRRPRLYILFLLHLSRVSKGLAHLEIELCSSISDLLHERDCGPSTEKIHLGFKTPHGKIPSWIQDLLTEKNRLLFVSSVVDFGSCILHLCSSI